MVDIVINQRDEGPAGTQIDSIFDEPIAVEMRESSCTVQGQIRNDLDDRLKRTRTGDGSDSAGHVLFRKSDLDDAGVTLKKGDRITKIAGVDFDVVIIEVTYKAPLRGVFLLVQCPFVERTAVRGSQ